MRQGQHCLQLMVIGMVGMVLGCASAPPQESAPPNAFFVAAPKDAEAYRELAREQDQQLKVCAATRSCDRIHFVRALTALYENQAVAVKHFNAVIATAPNGRYAASSLQWVRLLQEGRNGATRELQLMHAAQRLVHDLLNREMETQFPPREVKETKPKDSKPEPSSVQALRKELKARNKRIDELTQQIEALKLVDQEVREKTRSATEPSN